MYIYIYNILIFIYINIIIYVINCAYDYKNTLFEYTFIMTPPPLPTHFVQSCGGVSIAEEHINLSPINIQSQ